MKINSKILEKPAKTFSIGFAEPKYNELDFARIAVNRFGTQQHEYCVTPEDVVYDTLSNGKIIATNLPGEILQVPVDENETYLRTNFDKSNEINFRDGDRRSSRRFDQSFGDDEDLVKNESETKDLKLFDLAKEHSKSESTEKISKMYNILKRQLKKGMKVEMEHDMGLKKAKKIAMDHLKEDPRYYDKLEKIESKEATGAGSARATTSTTCRPRASKTARCTATSARTSRPTRPTSAWPSA